LNLTQLANNPEPLVVATAMKTRQLATGRPTTRSDVSTESLTTTAARADAASTQAMLFTLRLALRHPAD
jgi:hypothetical protein